MTTAITWDSVMILSDRLAERVKADGYRPNMIVAVARGGFVPARLLSSRLSIARLSSIGVRYQGESRRDHTFYSFPDPINERDYILLVEDVLETGRTLRDARQLLRTKAAEVRTGAYYYQQGSVIVPDYSLGATRHVPTFPWE